MFEARSEIGVSFCIPNWNHRAYIARSLRSAIKAALALSRADIPAEIIIVDDASRDGSQKALFAAAMMETRVSVDVIVLQKNRGLGAARNVALSNARFRYACFLDADNELISENVVTLARAMQDTDAAVVYGNLLKHDGETCSGLLSNDFIGPAIFKDNYIDALALCHRDRILALGGFDEQLTSHEDWEMWLHLLAERQQIVFVPICLAYYYVNPNSMVQTKTDVDFARFNRIFNQRQSDFLLHSNRKRMYHPDIGWLL